jgi:hypothetical protein
MELLRRARDALRPFELEQAPSGKTADNTPTETPPYGSRNSSETRRQRAVTTPGSEKPVIPPLPIRSSSDIILQPVVSSGTDEGGSAGEAVKNSVLPPAIPPHSSASQLQGHFNSSSVTSKAQQVPAVTVDQGTTVDNTR